MCGIVGYLGKKNALGPVLDGLQALEYRGYDSAGIAYFDGGGHCIKQVGRVEALNKAVKLKVRVRPQLAIGHTRWATHGAPTITNAHPHTNQDGSIFVVHNGIIENYTEIKANLIELGYKFVSDTDTEVIPQLIDFHYKKLKSIENAFEQAISELRGAYAIAMVSSFEPQTLYAARLSSPLIIGVGEKEFFLASDPTAIMEHTKKVVYLNDYEMVRIDPTRYRIRNIQKSKKIRRVAELLDFDFEQARLGDYPNFMIKEIYEAPQTIRMATLGRIRPESSIVKLGGLANVELKLNSVERILIVACGTSYYAGLVGEYLIEELAGIPVEVQLASEFKYREEPFLPNTAVLAISQSGETADTIAALKKIEGTGMLRLGIVNAVGSTIARMTDAGVYCHAGPEQAVASTKAFIAQVTILNLLALKLSKGRPRQFKTLLQDLEALPKKAEEVLAQADKIKKIAERYSRFNDFLFIGRRFGYPLSLEGALKLKEIAYIHAEGYAAGEMKHGPLAMIDKNFGSFAIACDGPTLEKTYSNIQEIKARGGPVVAVATKGNKHIAKLADHVFYVPKSMEQTQTILAVIVLQLFAYFAALKLGQNVDRPRNLAKSVTVE